MSIFENPTPQDETLEQASEQEHPAEEVASETGVAETEDAVEDSAEEHPEAADAVQDKEETAPDEGKPVNWEKRYKDLQRYVAELKKQKEEPRIPSVEDPEVVFNEAFASNPRGVIAQMALAAAQQIVAPLKQAQAEARYSANINVLANDYPALATEEGHKAFSQTLIDIASDWGSPHLVENPPFELMEIAAQKTFGSSKAKLYQAALKKGEQKAIETIKSKKGLAIETKKPKITQKTPEEEEADAIVQAALGRRGIFG